MEKKFRKIKQAYNRGNYYIVTYEDSPDNQVYYSDSEYRLVKVKDTIARMNLSESQLKVLAEMEAAAKAVGFDDCAEYYREE
jgi:hypothetical protein